MTERLQHHFQTGLDDETGDDRTDNTVHRNVAEVHYRCRDQRRCRYDGIKTCIRTGSYQCIRTVLFSLCLHIMPQDQFCDHGNNNDDYCHDRVIRLCRLYDLFNRFYKRRCSGRKNDQCDHDRTEVFDPPVPERMIFIRFFFRQFDAQYRDHRTECIRQIVDCIQHDRNRTGYQTCSRLKCRKKNIGTDPYDAGSCDRFFPFLIICHLSFLQIHLFTRSPVPRSDFY